MFRQRTPAAKLKMPEALGHPPRFFYELKRHHDMKEPRPEDFLTEDDYEAAVDAYEAAVYEAEERAIEEYYERKTKSR